MKKIYTFFILCVYAFIANAATYEISFTGSGAASSIDSIIVQNLVTNEKIKLSGDDVLAITVDGINDVYNYSTNDIFVSPNPITNSSAIVITPPVSGEFLITVSDITGKIVVQRKANIDSYGRSFNISGLLSGLYIISVDGNGYRTSAKLLSQSSGGELPVLSDGESISLSGSKANLAAKGNKATVNMDYEIGQWVKFTGYSGDYGTVVTDTIIGSKTIDFEFIDCTDSDGNHYEVVRIQSQVWMAENLMSTKTVYGGAIALVQDELWSTQTVSAYCVYPDDQEGFTTPSILYNWFAASDYLNICPEGWHVPTHDEWDTLSTHIGGYVGAGIKVNETGTEHWLETNSWTNETGLTFVPGGFRYNTNPFSFNGERNYLWSSTQYSEDDTRAIFRHTGTNNNINFGHGPKEYGQAIRCILDPPIEY